MTRTQWLIVAALGLGVVFEFCLIGFVGLNRLPVLTGQQAAVVVGTATVVPLAAASPTDSPSPTATPTPTGLPSPSATATLVIQSAGRIFAGTQTPHPRVPGPIQDAWDKSTQAKSMRFIVEMTMKGDLGTMPGMTTPMQEFPLMSMSGETSGKDSHLIMKGFIAMFLTGDPTKSLEMMTVGGKSYVHGPMPLFGAPEDKWYVGGADSGLNMGSSEDPVQSFKGQNQDWSKFKKTGTEKFDGRSCDVYSADKEAAMEFFNEFSKQSQQSQSLDQLSNAELKVWVCDDGYFHQLRMSMEGSAKDKPNQKVSILMLIHFSDLNANIKITPPPSPAPLKTPAFFNFGTPTPQAGGGTAVPKP